MTGPASSPDGTGHGGRIVHQIWGGELATDAADQLEWQETSIEPISVVRIVCTGTSSFRRSARAVRRFEQAFHVVTFVESGVAAIQPSHETIRIERDHFVITKISTAYKAEFLPGDDPCFANYTIRLPDHLILPHFAHGVRYGHPIPAKAGAGAAARSMARLIHEHAADMASATLARTIDLLCELIGQAVKQEGADAQPQPGSRERHWQAIVQHIDRNIANPDLSLLDVAHRIGISSRYINMILHDKGLRFRDMVLARRMEIARRLMQDADLQDHTIAHISHICGFKNAAHFSTCFSRTFGMTAGAYRMAARRTHAGSAADA